MNRPTTCKYCKAKLKPVPLLDGVWYCENSKCEMNYAVDAFGKVVADERLEPSSIFRS